jgi:hypothetical protein
MRRTGELAALGLAFALLVLLAFAGRQDATSSSTYSSYEDGPNGYLLLFNVLAREGVRVTRSGVPYGLIDPATRVLVLTSVKPEFASGRLVSLEASDRAVLARFLAHGGRIVYFTEPGGDSLRLSRRPAIAAQRLDVTRFTNAALAAHPRQALQAYRALAGSGPVAFEERVHGYGDDRSMWSVLPNPVRLAFWIVCVAALLLLVDANVRFAPVRALDPPAERDSSDYIVSMAALLQRARAGAAAIARFARAYPNNEELQRLAAISLPADATVLRAAQLYHQLRKDRS